MSDFLYARPSLLEGIGRNVDLFGVMQQYNKSSTAEEADHNAIMADWIAIGDDFQSSVLKVANELKARQA